MNNLEELSLKFQQLVKLGIVKELSFIEKLRVELCNLFVVISLPAGILHLIYNFLGPNDLKEYFIVGVWLMIVATTLGLNHLKKYLLARNFILYTGLVFAATVHLLFGEDAKTEPLYLLLILVNCYFLNKRSAIIQGIIVVVVYILIALRVYYAGAPFAEQLVPSGPYMYMAYAIIVTVILTTRVLKENKIFTTIIEEKNRRLIEKNEELERFTYIASHDLKSPLGNLINFSTLIELDLKREKYENIPKHLEYLKTSARQMKCLIEDVLEFSNIDSRDNDKKELIDLNKVLEKVQYNLHQEIENKNAKIMAHPLPTYHCNEVRFAILFQNLIQNGIKYNKQQRPIIAVWSTNVDGVLNLYFKDNGIGIEEAYQQQVFGYFKRLHNKNEYEGTGIGLAMCKKIVENCNGQLTIQSTVGKGSTFVVSLPIVTKDAKQQMEMATLVG